MFSVCLEIVSIENELQIMTKRNEFAALNYVYTHLKWLSKAGFYTDQSIYTQLFYTARNLNMNTYRIIYLY